MADSPNVVLVVLDTLRKDVVSAYGGGGMSPHLDKLASDGVVYRNCVASSPWTTPSHASLFTGLLPSKHGVHETKDRKIIDIFGDMAKVRAQPLAGYLADRGYATACYSANVNISPGSGFERGFSAFEVMYGPVPDEATTKAVQTAKKYGKSRGEIAKKMLKRGKVPDLMRLYSVDRKLKSLYRERNYPLFKGGDKIAEEIARLKLEEPFFLFVNLLEMHEPYLSGRPGGEPDALTDMFGTWEVDPALAVTMKAKYLEELSAVDAFLGKITGWLKQTSKYDGTLVLATSDHGQALKEKGYFGHGTYMHDEILEVPLVVKYPKGAKPKQAEGYQPLHRVPELVKDGLVGVFDGESLTREYAISESFGVPNKFDRVENAPGFEKRKEEVDRPRKAVYKGGLKLVIDGTDGRVEEFTLNGKPLDRGERRDAFKELVGLLASLRDSSFALPD